MLLALGRGHPTMAASLNLAFVSVLLIQACRVLL